MGVSASQHRACIGCFNILRLEFRGGLGSSCSFCSPQNLLIIIFYAFFYPEILKLILVRKGRPHLVSVTGI